MKWPFCLRSTLDRKVKYYEAVTSNLHGSIKNLVDAREMDRLEIQKLRMELAQAQKNDTPHDPKTGRFMKKEQ
jgi:hypothetical protein